MEDTITQLKDEEKLKEALDLPDLERIALMKVVAAVSWIVALIGLLIVLSLDGDSFNGIIFGLGMVVGLNLHILKEIRNEERKG
jgi:preprotein translocase subunit SecD